MRVLLVEPWFTGSHAAWANGFRSVSTHDVRLASLPGQAWRTRLRSGAAELVPVIESVIDDGWMPDCLLVSGIVDVATLVGLVGTTLGTPPIVVYQHESQIIYPNQSGAIDVEATIHNVNSWLAADAIWFNTAYHRDAVRSALTRHSGDVGPVLSELASHALAQRSSVMPVGVDLAWTRQSVSASAGTGPRILWPHRWDWDKRPDVFMRALRRLATQTTDFRLVLAGDDGAESGVRDQIAAELPDQVDAVGPFSTEDYRRWLLSCDIVVSCAEHEFFGIGVVEALAAGCVGVLPDNLSYPEIVGSAGAGMLYSGRSFGTALQRAVSQWPAPEGRVRDSDQTVRRFDWGLIGPTYDSALSEVNDATGGGRTGSEGSQ